MSEIKIVYIEDLLNEVAKNYPSPVTLPAGTIIKQKESDYFDIG